MAAVEKHVRNSATQAPGAQTWNSRKSNSFVLPAGRRSLQAFLFALLELPLRCRNYAYWSGRQVEELEQFLANNTLLRDPTCKS
jgi:hypothetical protein